MTAHRYLAPLRRLEATKPFAEHEAWWLFRAAALAEAAGWTILIAGILIRHYQLPGSRIAVPIAGQVHGTIFIAYFGVLLATYSSLNWSRRKFLAAIVAGIPPYGTLAFEQWAAWTRSNKNCRLQFRSIVLHALAPQPPELADS